MKGEKQMSAASGIGVTTLFVVLLILCLTVFSVLTFASAQADLRLSRKTAEMVGSHYAADSAGAAISAMAGAFWAQGAARPTPEDCERLEQDISAYAGAEVSYAEVSDDGEGFAVAYGISIDTLLALEIELYLPAGGVCEALSWRVVSHEPGQTEEWLPVWQG
jgi:hypothetical protein